MWYFPSDTHYLLHFLIIFFSSSGFLKGVWTLFIIILFFFLAIHCWTLSVLSKVWEAKISFCSKHKEERKKCSPIKTKCDWLLLCIIFFLLLYTYWTFWDEVTSVWKQVRQELTISVVALCFSIFHTSWIQLRCFNRRF